MREKMNTKITTVIPVLIAVLFVSALAGTVSYYNGELNDRNSKISSLNSQVVNLNNEIANLTNQVSNLTAEVTNLTSANLVNALNVTEMLNNSDLVQAFPNIPVTSIPYDSLWINGSITNTGHVTALNAGLHVVAYASEGTLEINMTVPVGNGDFGTSYAINSYVQS